MNSDEDKSMFDWDIVHLEKENLQNAPQNGENQTKNPALIWLESMKNATISRLFDNSVQTSVLDLERSIAKVKRELECNQILLAGVDVECTKLSGVIQGYSDHLQKDKMKLLSRMKDLDENIVHCKNSQKGVGEMIKDTEKAKISLQRQFVKDAYFWAP